MDITRSKKADSKLVMIVVEVAVILLVAIATLAILLTQNARPTTRTAAASSQTTTHVALDIMPVKPGGPVEDWPAYMASTPLTVPANSLVTVTIRNFDLGDDALANDSPLLQVQGTTNNTAVADGKAYTSLDATHVSHTFTIAQLHLNVPIPGDPVGDANHVTVTFSFRTPAEAGTYTFQCYVPCGTGPSGFDGPMNIMGYMKGTLTVQG